MIALFYFLPVLQAPESLDITAFLIRTNHMDMILARFRFMNLDTLILAQLSDHLSDILFDLSVYDLSPVFRCEYDMIFTFPLRSVYKELHADRETGC